MRLPDFGVFEGVLHQVAEDLMHGVGIGHDERVGRAGGLEFDAGVDDDAADGVDRILQQDAGADRLQRELVVGALDAGEGEQILGETIHAAGVLEDDAEKFERGFGLGLGSSMRVST